MENKTIQFIFILALPNIAYYNSNSQCDSVIKKNAEKESLKMSINKGSDSVEEIGKRL